MPHQDIADTIVEIARQSLRRVVEIIESKFGKFNCKVIYGDTDSVFVRCKNMNLDQA